MSATWQEDDVPRCSCPGCPDCNEWPAYGPGCWHKRNKYDKGLAEEDMRCFKCASLRDEEARTQAKSAGKGSRGTGSGAVAGSTSWEDHPRIAQQREIPALRRIVNQLKSQVAELDERVESLEGSQR